MAWADLSFTSQLSAYIWFAIVAFCFVCAGFFFQKRKLVPKENSPFFLGLGIFCMTYGVARLLENVRKYFISTDLNDIVNAWKAGTQINGVNWDLRVLYYVIAWIGIAILFANVENYAFRKKSKFLITIAAMVEGTVSIALYEVPAGSLAFLSLITVASIGYFVPCVAIAGLFGFLARNAPGMMRSCSIGALVGVVMTFTGILGDLPEASFIAGTFFPDWVYGIVAPIVTFGGLLILFVSFWKMFARG